MYCVIAYFLSALGDSSSERDWSNGFINCGSPNRQSPLKECMSLHMGQKLRLILSNFELEYQVIYKVHNSKAHKTGNHKHLTFKKRNTVYIMQTCTYQLLAIFTLAKSECV